MTLSREPMRFAARRSSHGDGGQYATLVKDPNTDPVVMALAPMVVGGSLSVMLLGAPRRAP